MEQAMDADIHVDEFEQKVLSSEAWRLYLEHNGVAERVELLA